MIPRIPDNCERFKTAETSEEFIHQKGDYLYRLSEWGYLESEWVTVEAVLAYKDVNGPMGDVWRDLCNAARCAWLDEAERERDTGNPVLSNLVCHFIYLIAPKYLDVSPYPVCEPWEIDYAHCLAWAEAWAREAKG